MCYPNACMKLKASFKKKTDSKEHIDGETKYLHISFFTEVNRCQPIDWGQNQDLSLIEEAKLPEWNSTWQGVEAELMDLHLSYM